jgi:cell division transport system ATP-binding protein
MILFDRVTKIYGKDNKPALNRVSLHIEPSEFVIIVGTSGAGKSTLLKLLTREEKPTSGKIVVGGIDYDTLKDRQIPLLRRKIGVVFQDFKLLPQRTVFENIAFALEIAGMTNREIKTTVPKVIELVGLTGKEKKFPHMLSGGERQRVAIARAVVRQPKILIADEPTGNLDPRHSWDIVRLLEKINRYGTTVLLTTHNVEIVNRLKRRVITIDHGKVTADQVQGSYKQGTANGKE